MDLIFARDILTEGDYGNGAASATWLSGGLACGLPVGSVVATRGQAASFDTHTVRGVALPAAEVLAMPFEPLPGASQWQYVYQTVSACGLLSRRSAIASVTIEVDGSARSPAPNAPIDLTAQQAGDEVTLTWRYNHIDQVKRPKSFVIYADTGSGFDFDTALATVLLPFAPVGAIERQTWTSSGEISLTDGQWYRFVVRAADAAGNESPNSNAADLLAETGGPAAFATVAAAWSEVDYEQ